MSGTLITVGNAKIKTKASRINNEEIKASGNKSKWSSVGWNRIIENWTQSSGC